MITMSLVVVLFSLTLVASFVSCEPDPSTPTNLLDFARSLYYEELGCNKTEGSGSRFDCPTMSRNTSDTDSCLFRDQSYSKGARLDDETTLSQCMAQCVCNR